MTQESKSLWERWRGFLPPVLLFVALVTLAVVFHHVVLPFFVALFVVYLIEPIVARMSVLEVANKRLGRGPSVLLVYTVVIAAVSVFSLLFVPRVLGEVATLSNQAPEILRELREERLPRVNDWLTRLIGEVSPPAASEVPVEKAQERVDDAIDVAVTEALLVSGLSSEERVLYDDGSMPVIHSSSEGDVEDVLLRLRTAEDGTVEVLPGDHPVSFIPEGEGYRLVFAEPPEAQREEGTIDLESALTESLGGSVEGSGEQLAMLLEFGQRLLEGLIETFFTVLVTFMVAAFVSIDVPHIVAFILTLFPRDSRQKVGRLMGRLNVGLSGVIRGQLVICVINGLLTGIGLVILKVKFALLLALIAAVLSLIPIFGTILSTIPAVAIGLTQSFTTGLLVLVWILIIHFIEGNILNPKIIGTTAEIHPAIVVFALLAGEHTFGLLGALLAVPTASILQTLFLFLKEELDGPVEIEISTESTDGIPHEN